MQGIDNDDIYMFSTLSVQTFQGNDSLKPRPSISTFNPSLIFASVDKTLRSVSVIKSFLWMSLYIVNSHFAVRRFVSSYAAACDYLLCALGAAKTNSDEKTQEEVWCSWFCPKTETA